MYVVGITGGIGSGKSTLRRLLEAKGAATLDMDLIARKLIDDSLGIRQELAAVFGPQILDEHGALIRSALAKTAFKDEASTQAMNAVTLPHIVEEAARQIAAARDDADESALVLVVEMPILTETPGLAKSCDEVIAVEVPQDVRIERCVGRGMTVQDAANRIACQPSDADRAALADTICPNGGTADELAAWVDVWWQQRIG